MTSWTATRLHRDLIAAGLQVESVSVGIERRKDTYLVLPDEIQAQAAFIIDAFDDSLEADDAWIRDQQKAYAKKTIGSTDGAAIRAVSVALIDALSTAIPGLKLPTPDELIQKAQAVIDSGQIDPKP